MSVRKRKWITRKGESKQAWIVDYIDQDGDRHIETFERKKDADAFHATVKVDVSKGEHIAASKSETIAQAAQHWLNSVEARGRERGTLRQYRQHVDLHIVPRLGSIKLAHLTAPKVKAFRDDLLANLSRPLARKVLVSFKSILKEAKRTQVAAGISIGADQRKRKLEVGVDIPTPDEIKRLLHAAADAEIRPRMLLTLAIFTGLRASELRGLRWKDVDLKHSELHVQQRADRFNAIGMPKSRASVRKVGFGARVLDELKHWKLACPISELDLVFPTATGGGRLSQGYAAQSRRHHEGSACGGQKRQPEIRLTCHAALLRVVVHQPQSRWRARTAAQERVTTARAFVDCDHARHLRASVPDQ
jgi:integrase